MTPPAPVVATRRQRDVVTIVHLSDWHLVGEGERLRYVRNPDAARDWQGLVDDLRAQQPDLVCITGDIVDNPFGGVAQEAGAALDTLKRWLGSDEATAWDRRLAATFAAARALFDRLCRDAGLDPSVALHVVPGNHDFRLQGIVDRRSCRERFDEAFGDRFGSARRSFAAPGGGAPIDVALVGFDSLAVDVAGNFATGAISRDEYERFAAFGATDAADDPLRPSFRVALVHHHPLPVVPSETLIDATPARDEGRIDGIARVAQGEQTMLFRNGGTFLHGALTHRVDLILHGHHHRSWFTVVRYPTEAGDHRMLVAAAGSIGEETDGGWRYNVVRLHANGNIDVEERTRAANPPGYRGVPRLKLFGAGELRLVRHEAARRALVASDRAATPRVGLAEAEQVRRRIVIRDDGSADYTIRLAGLRATGRELPWLTIAQQFSPGVSIGRRDCRVLGADVAPYRVTLVPEAGGDPSLSALGLRFDPPLAADRPADVELHYQVYNAFDFVDAYFRGREGQADVAVPEESVAYAPQRIFARRLLQTIVFPPGWRPPSPPRFEVRTPADELDRDEQAYHASALDWLDEQRVATLSIDLPLPGRAYVVTWPLDTLADYTKARYTESSARSARALRRLELSEAQRADVAALLARLQRDWSAPARALDAALFDARTELLLHLVREPQVGDGATLRAQAHLEPIGTAGRVLPGHDAGHALPGGAGLIGYAHRSGRTQTMARGRDLEAYLPRDAGTPYAALCCVPLLVPGRAKPAADATPAATTRTPVFAILSAGTLEAGSPLAHPEDAVFRDFEAYATGAFARALFERLIAGA